MNDTNTITCPQCSEEIPITDALTGKIKQEMQKEIQVQKDDLLKREKQIEISQKNIELEVKTKVEEEKKEIWVRAQEKAKENSEKTLKDLEAQNAEKSAKLAESEKNELDLRKQARELEEKDRNRELEMARQMDEERKKIEIKTRLEAEEESRQKFAEKDQVMEQMKKTIDDLKRKSEQGSMQVQGDSQEEALKGLLQSNYPIDDIVDVATGVRGADIIQTVKSDFGQECGIVLWESKTTKQWSDAWIQKLKDDQVEAKASIAILITASLPKGVEGFTQIQGVWVVSFQAILPIISAIRFHLIELARTKNALEGQDEKMKFLYEYLSGAQFKNRIENIVSAFTGMQVNLTAEKRAMNKLWAKREKEIERVVLNTSGMYGDLQGLIGASLPTIQSLELPAGDDSIDVEEE